MVMTKTYKGLLLREREILRYAGCKAEEEETVRLMRQCVREAEEAGVLEGRLCYAEFPLAVCAEDNTDAVCEFAGIAVVSEDLAKNLKGCTAIILMAATAGVGLDRLITKYGRLAPSKALMFQAIGAELTEQVCNTFSKEYTEEQDCRLRPRFSPGYGDLPLDCQRDIFSLLDCARKIGLTLNNSLLMSPSKSVTAFVGVDKR